MFEVPTLLTHIYVGCKRMLIQAYVLNAEVCTQHCLWPLWWEWSQQHPLRECPTFIDAKNIQELRVKEGLTFPQARKQFQESKQTTFRNILICPLVPNWGWHSDTKHISFPILTYHILWMPVYKKSCYFPFLCDVFIHPTSWCF